MLDMMRIIDRLIKIEYSKYDIIKLAQIFDFDTRVLESKIRVLVQN